MHALIGCSWLLIVGFTLQGSPLQAAEASLTPAMVIDKSIAHHDPNGVWESARIQLNIDTEYSEEYAANATSREVKLALMLAPHFEEFHYVKETGSDTIEIGLQRGVGSLEVNGKTEVSKADLERLRIREPQMYRNYCEYLYGMPMKLRDPGTIVDPLVQSSRFAGQDVLQVKVTYEPEIGSNTWYFYFHPTTCALVGYRFYFDEAKKDGEYIVFEAEIVDAASGLRLPKVRAWYFNVDDAHLATDDITSVTVAR